MYAVEKSMTGAVSPWLVCSVTTGADVQFQATCSFEPGGGLKVESGSRSKVWATPPFLISTVFRASHQSEIHCVAMMAVTSFWKLAVRFRSTRV